MYTFNINEISESKNPNNGTFLQTPFWCEFKAHHGWSYKRFQINYSFDEKAKSDFYATEEDNDCKHNKTETELNKTFEIAVLTRSFCKGLFHIAYTALMPELPFECTENSILDSALENHENNVSVIGKEIITPDTQAIEFASLLSELGLALKKYLPKNTVFFRFDPAVGFDYPEDRDLFNYGIKTIAFADKLKLKKSKVDIQPPDSTLVDLTGTEEEILNRMHSKWRYNIRLSERKGVVVHRYIGTSEELQSKIDKFYELTKETNQRDGNSSHGKAYYYDLIKTSGTLMAENRDVPVISLYIAEHEGDKIASIMTLFSHDEAIYLYGASSNNKRNLMPNHLLQWTAMKDAKEYGSKIYDMYGMPPEGKDENHPMHGLYMFKANFGGKNIHRTGSWDVPLKPYVFALYNVAESIRAWWFKKVMKKIRGR